jgi:hypothetical protein
MQCQQVDASAGVNLTASRPIACLGHTPSASSMTGNHDNGIPHPPAFELTEGSRRDAPAGLLDAEPVDMADATVHASAPFLFGQRLQPKAVL